MDRALTNHVEVRTHLDGPRDAQRHHPRHHLPPPNRVDGVLTMFTFSSCDHHFDYLVRVVRYSEEMNARYEGDGDIYDEDWGD